MKRGFVVNCDLFTRADVAQRVKLYVPVQNFHETVRLARMIDVVRAVASTTPIQTPTGIYRADSEQGAIGPALGLCGRDSFARVIRNLMPARETKRGKASLAVDGRFFDD